MTLQGSIGPDSTELRHAEYGAALARLDAARSRWVETQIPERIALLKATKDAIAGAAEEWVSAAADYKQLPSTSKHVGEEWLSGPYALMAMCNALIHTLADVHAGKHLDDIKSRSVPGDRIAIEILPHSVWDRLLLSGVSAEIWMRPGVTRQNLRSHAAIAYSENGTTHDGKVALVLGAGNITSIGPLDCFDKLFRENQVTLLKLNPIADGLEDALKRALAPLIDAGFTEIVTGDGQDGDYLCNHPLVSEIHITGAGATHDLIVWGSGEAGAANRLAGKPRNTRRITSELGAVCPTIVVPGPWSEADLTFQAENIVTQKLHNSGHNCVACQVLILPETWSHEDKLTEEIGRFAEANQRETYYPGTEQRIAQLRGTQGPATDVARGEVAPLMIADHSDEDADNAEVFGPAMSVRRISDAEGAEAYLVAAIEWANTSLYGTLGANIVIHPKTIAAIGTDRFDEILTTLEYGTIAINCWTGVAFLQANAPWGAFPGHTLEDIQSGIGTVHNALLLENTERTVIKAPWRPFPRSLLRGQFSLLPRPPWFVTNATQATLGRLLVKFQHRPAWSKLPRIFWHALRG